MTHFNLRHSPIIFPDLPNSVPTHPKRCQRNTTTMVKVEIVQDQDEANNSPYASHASSRTGSSASLSSVESELGDESFYERLAALKDIVPPSTRHSVSSKVSSTASFLKKGGKILGNIVWIVTTSALLVGLPLALSLEDEAKIVTQEKEMLAQQQGAQQVCIHYTEFWVFFTFIDTFRTDARRRFLTISTTGFRTTAQGHSPSRFLILFRVSTLLSHTYAINPTPCFHSVFCHTLSDDRSQSGEPKFR